MTVYAEPSSYGTAEPVHFDLTESVLRYRMILPEEMAATLVEYFNMVFDHQDYLINPNLSPFAGDTSGSKLNIVSGLLADDTDVFPKLTVTPLAYKPAVRLTSVQEAGIQVRRNDVPLGTHQLSLMQGVCQCILRGSHREVLRSLASELVMLILRDFRMLQEQLHVRSIKVDMDGPPNEGTYDTGKDKEPGSGFRFVVPVTWIAPFQTQYWTERAF